MTNKIFSVATFVLVAWLSVTLAGTSHRMTAIEHTLTEKIDSSQQTLSKRIRALEGQQKIGYREVLAGFEKINTKPAIVPQQFSNPKTNADKPTKRIAEDKLKEIRTAYLQVLEAEFEKATDATAAAEKLLGTKKAIWKASMQHEAVATDLQELMGPIDYLAGQWQSGDTSNSVQPVYNVLTKTLVTLEAKK